MVYCSNQLKSPPQKYENGKEGLLGEELGKYDLATIPPLLC